MDLDPICSFCCSVALVAALVCYTTWTEDSGACAGLTIEVISILASCIRGRDMA